MLLALSLCPSLLIPPVVDLCLVRGPAGRGSRAFLSVPAPPSAFTSPRISAPQGIPPEHLSVPQQQPAFAYLMLGSWAVEVVPDSPSPAPMLGTACAPRFWVQGLFNGPASFSTATKSPLVSETLRATLSNLRP